MATDIERAAEIVAPRTCLSGDAACDICTSEVRDGLQALLDAGWTLIPPATDDLPEGWRWSMGRDSTIFVYGPGNRLHAHAELASTFPVDDCPPIFAPWVADRLARLLAELGEG